MTRLKRFVHVVRQNVERATRRVTLEKHGNAVEGGLSTCFAKNILISTSLRRMSRRIDRQDRTKKAGDPKDHLLRERKFTIVSY